MSGPKTNALPTGWARATLGDVCDPPQYGWTTSATDEFNAIKLLRSTDISHGTVNWETVPFCETPPPVIEKYQLYPGDIVITRTGAGVGNSLLLDDCPPSVFASYLIRFRPHAALSTKYVAYFLKGPSYRTLISQNAAGIAQPNVNAAKLASLALPVPPRKTQDAIVAEIEKQFTRLDAAVAALERTKANLSRYRATVLKSACEGRLVPSEAELAKRDVRSYESASVLLGRIFDERRVSWEGAQVNKSRTAGRVPHGDRLTFKYATPAVPKTESLNPLPEGWGWATTDQLTRGDRPSAYGVLQPGDDIEDGVPFVRVGDIGNGRIRVAGLKRISAEIASNYPRTLLRGGEVLITLVGAIGRTAVAPPSLAGANTARAVGVIPVSPILNAHWIEIWFRNPDKIQEMTAKAHEVARKTLNLEDVRSATIAIPPLCEQVRIVEEVERRMSVVDEVELQIELNLKRAERLRQAVLRCAFEGKLVPQDPSDEPASALLERIHEAREAAPKPSLGRGRWKKEAQHVS